MSGMPDIPLRNYIMTLTSEPDSIKLQT